MKILTIADKESKNFWDFYEPGKLDGIDLIISCGDLDPHYLSFLATFAHCPVLYVHGNHDYIYDRISPDGCICIDDKIYVHEGIRILGLGGSMRYKLGPYQYEQNEMKKRVAKLWLSLKKHKGFDILVTHSPAKGVGDGEDRCHQGFESFLSLMDKYSPRYFIHGHVHQNYGRQYKRLGAYNNTLIINAYETYIFEYETEYDFHIEKQQKIFQKKVMDEKEKQRLEDLVKEQENKLDNTDYITEEIACHGKIMSEG